MVFHPGSVRRVVSLRAGWYARSIGLPSLAAHGTDAKPDCGNPAQLQEDTMEAHEFDRVTRLVSARFSRRTLAGLLGLSAAGVASLTEAKKKKKKKVRRNSFGCVDVGKYCKNGGQCCSGICTGKKNTRKCQAHDESTCQPGQDSCAGAGSPIPCTTTAGLTGQCVITTGKAAYCLGGGDCFPCTRDADCAPAFGAGAACIVCTSECSGANSGSTACAGLAEPL